VAEHERLLGLDEVSPGGRHGQAIFDEQGSLLIAFQDPHQQFEFKAAQRIGLAFFHLTIGFMHEVVQCRHQFEWPPDRIGYALQPDAAEMLRTAQGRGGNLGAQHDLLPR
jgi:hypothetical protein